VTQQTYHRTLYLIVCGAGPAPDAGRLVTVARQRAWDVHLIATPSALRFIDVPNLEELTTRPVRSAYRQPGEGQRASLPHASVIIVAPATYNTINKWAHGTSDTYALGILAESIGLGIPVVVLPFVNSALATHFAFARSVRELRGAGVRVLMGPGDWEPHAPGTGGKHVDSFPWRLALDAAESMVRATPPSARGDRTS
jgi:phosphopantothenoylcysteine synthetase/decarboxylase